MLRKRLPRLLWWLRPNTFQADDDSAVVLIDRFQLRYYALDLLDPHLNAAAVEGAEKVAGPPLEDTD